MIENKMSRGSESFAIGIVARLFGKIFHSYAEEISYGDRYVFREEYMGFDDELNNEEQNHFEVKENIITIKPKEFRKKL